MQGQLRLGAGSGVGNGIGHAVQPAWRSAHRIGGGGVCRMDDRRPRDGARTGLAGGSGIPAALKVRAQPRCMYAPAHHLPGKEMAFTIHRTSAGAVQLSDSLGTCPSAYSTLRI